MKTIAESIDENTKLTKRSVAELGELKDLLIVSRSVKAVRQVLIWLAGLVITAGAATVGWDQIKKFNEEPPASIKRR